MGSEMCIRDRVIEEERLRAVRLVEPTHRRVVRPAAWRTSWRRGRDVRQRREGARVGAERMREKTREERSESTRDGRRSDEGGTATVRAGTHCRPCSASSGGMPNDCATCRWVRRGFWGFDRGGQSRSLAGTDDRVSVDADRARSRGTTERRICAGNAPETRPVTRRRRVLTRNDARARPKAHQAR